MKNVKMSRWVRLALAALALLFAGVIYAWSSISAPFTEEFGWTGAPLKMTYTLCLIFFCLGGLASGLLSKKMGLMPRMLIAAALMALGLCLTAALDGKSLFALYITYGVLAGTGAGFAYNCVISSTSAWFPDRKGVCNGVMMMAFGFSALLIGKAAAALFAPGAMGWRQTYALLGGVTGAVLAVLSLMMRFPGADDALPPAPAKASSGADIPSGEMVKRASFYKLFVFFFLLASVGSTAIGSTREIVSVFFADPADAASLAVNMVGIVAIMNGLGRLISGAVYDGLGLRKAQYVTSAVAIVAPAVALVAIVTRSLPLGIAGLCLCGISFGFSPTLTAAFVGGFYGQKHFSLNFSLANLVLIPAAFISTLTAFLNTQTGSLVASFALLTAFSVIGLFINLSIKKA